MHCRSGWVALVLLSGCSDYALEVGADKNAGGDPAIEVEPEVLDFWTVAAEEAPELRSFVVRSVGDGPLYVGDLDLAPGLDFTLVDPPADVLLEPGAELTVDVAFSPTAPAAQQADVVVNSDDPDRPALPVTLLGEGRVPRLEITPPSHDFGALSVPCADRTEFLLQNVGNAALTVDATVMEGDPGYALAVADALPLTLQPGAWTTAEVSFAPLSDSALVASLVVDSTDPRGTVSAGVSGEGTAGELAEDSFSIPDNPSVDLLFAVDRSCSMDDDAEALAGSFGDFIAAVEAETSGWQLGAVTLDSGCFNEGVLRADTPDLAATFTAAVTTGEDADIADDEALFKLLDRALDQTGEGSCNAGFRRDGAPLHVVVVSDEPERSAEQAAAWTWEFWLARLEDHAGGAPLLTVSGVVDTDDCNEGAAGYAEVIAATGGQSLSICSADWASYAASLASTSISAVHRFPLSQDASGAAITVWLDEVELGSGWSHDAETNAIVFDDAPAGSTLRVTYGLAEGCD